MLITALPKPLSQRLRDYYYYYWMYSLVECVKPAVGFNPDCVLQRVFQMNMLLRLQEAANYSSTQSCDSDSTSHHDEQLDSSLESAL